MTDSSILHRYAGKASDQSNVHGLAPEAADDFGCFGWLRGIRDRAVMLELRKKDGNILAVGYGYLDHAEFNPSEGITLSVAGRKIQIKGRNLNAEVRSMVRLFEGITRHRVPWVCEADEPESLEADEGATVIDGIRW